MDQAAVQVQVMEGLARLSGGRTGRRAITPDTDIVAELGLDSLQVMEMLMEIEDALDVSIPVSILAEVRTAGDLTRAVCALLER